MGTTADMGAFSEMVIEKDFSGFTLYGSDGDVEATQDTYKTMYFLERANTHIQVKKLSQQLK